MPVRSRSRPPVVRLPPAARRLVAGVTVSSLGTGLTLPFSFVLLSEVRDLPLGTTGLLLAVPGAVGLVAVPGSGVLIDRVGPAAVLRVCLCLQALGSLLLGTGRTPAQVLPGLVLVGLGLGPAMPASGALLAGLVGQGAQQARAFGLQFTLLNAGVGTGGLIAAAVVDVDRPATFVGLYLGNTLACLAFAAVVPGGGAARTSADPAGPAPSYREVFADPVFRRVCALALLLAITGYAALDGGLPAYARVVGQVEPSTLGLLFAVNTAVIVLGQLAVLRLIGHWRRTTALAVAGGVWSLSWAVLLLLPVLDGAGAAALVLVFGGAFGVGETFLAPALQPLVNGVATDRLRGRYNALSQSSFSVALVVSPAVAAALVGAGWGVLWLGLIVAGSAAVPLVALRLRHRLTDEQDGIAHRPAVPVGTTGR